MHVPLALLIPWVFAWGVLFTSWFHRGQRLIEVEGRLAEYEEDDDDDGLSLDDMVRSGIVAPTSMMSPFAHASRAELFGDALTPPGLGCTMPPGWDGWNNYHGATGPAGVWAQRDKDRREGRR